MVSGQSKSSSFCFIMILMIELHLYIHAYKEKTELSQSIRGGTRIEYGIPCFSLIHPSLKMTAEEDFHWDNCDF